MKSKNSSLFVFSSSARFIKWKPKVQYLTTLGLVSISKKPGNRLGPKVTLNICIFSCLIWILSLSILLLCSLPSSYFEFGCYSGGGSLQTDTFHWETFKSKFKYRLAYLVDLPSQLHWAFPGIIAWYVTTSWTIVETNTKKAKLHLNWAARTILITSPAVTFSSMFLEVGEIDFVQIESRMIANIIGSFQVIFKWQITLFRPSFCWTIRKRPPTCSREMKELPLVVQNVVRVRREWKHDILSDLNLLNVFWLFVYVVIGSILESIVRVGLNVKSEISVIGGHRVNWVLPLYVIERIRAIKRIVHTFI